MKEWDWQHHLKDKWIYESPDGGSTVTKRPFMSNDANDKIVIKEKGIELKKENQYKFYAWLR